MTKLPVSKIRLDGGTQPRSEQNQQLVADYANDMREGAKFPAVIVFHDGECYWLVDGFHRVAAAKEISARQIEADIRQGTLQDAQWASFGVNAIHGLRRSNEDKRRAVIAALKHPNGANKANRDIARHCGVDEGTVRTYRAQLEATAEVPQSDLRVGADGRTINTGNIGAAPKYHVGQRVRYQGLIYDITAMTSGLKYNLRSALLNGKPETDVPEGEIQPFGAAQPPAAPASPANETLQKGDLVIGWRDRVVEISGSNTHGPVGYTLKGLPVEIESGAKRIDPSALDTLSEDQRAEVQAFLARRKPAESELHYRFAVGDTVHIIGTSDEAQVRLRVFNGHQEEYYLLEGYPKSFPVAALEAPLPVADDTATEAELDAELRSDDEQLAGQVNSDPEPDDPKPLAKGDQLKDQLAAANIMAFKVVAHNNGNNGTYSAGFFSDGTREQANGEALSYATLIRALGFTVLNAGVDIEPGHMTLGFGGQHTPIVHFADGDYEPSITESDEWYTPADVMTVVREFLGEIDLDPASCEAAQRTVQSRAYFDRKTNGLLHPWHGRVWLNSPYSRNWIKPFILKLIAERAAGHVDEAITIVNNSTETEWFQKLLTHGDQVCFVSQRINFEHPWLENPGNRQGQAFVYFGGRPLAFKKAFEQFGIVLPCASVKVAIGAEA